MLAKPLQVLSNIWRKKIRQDLIKHLLNWYSFLYVMFAKHIYSWLESAYLVKKMSWNDDQANAEILFGDGKNTDNNLCAIAPMRSLCWSTNICYVSKR